MQFTVSQPHRGIGKAWKDTIGTTRSWRPSSGSVQDDLVDEEGRTADPDEIERVVAVTAASLAEAPVQEFVPLLVEHQVRDELRQRGLRRELGEETSSTESGAGVEGDSAEIDGRTGR